MNSISPETLDEIVAAYRDGLGDPEELLERLCDEIAERRDCLDETHDPDVAVELAQLHDRAALVAERFDPDLARRSRRAAALIRRAYGLR